jgi:hypothetical protein
MSKLSRRNMVVGAAAMPALAVAIPAAAETDPVFAAIDRHRRARIARAASENNAGRLENFQRQWRWSVFHREPSADCDDDPAWIKAQLAVRYHAAAECEALASLAESEATTMAGLAEFIRYFLDEENVVELTDTWIGEYDETGRPLYIRLENQVLESVANSLDRIVSKTS